MKTQSNISTVSKTKTIIECCIVSIVIAGVITMIGKIDVRQFISNILDWQNM